MDDKINMIFRARSRLVIAFGWLAAAAIVSAQTSVVWTGLGNNGNWTTAANWQGNTVPANDGTAQVSFGASSRTSVSVNTSQSVKSLTFDFSPGTVSSYTLSGSSTTLTLGSGGLTATLNTLLAQTGTVTFGSSLGLVLGANQTWSTVSNTTVRVNGTVSGSGTITLNGDGYVRLSGNNTYSGGTILQSGLVGLESDTALGTGALTVTGDSSLYTTTAARSIANAINLNTTVLRLLPYGGDLHFTGNVTLGANPTIYNYSNPVYFDGPIGETGGARILTVSGGGAVTLSGANTYTGGTAVYGGALFFRNASSVPATGALSNSAQAYIGTGFNTGVQSGFIAKFSTANTFGTIGFDTDPTAVAAMTFTEPIDLSTFNNYARIGTATRAIFSSTAIITPATTAGYRFGGGGGTLTVQSKLTGANAVTVDSSPADPLKVYLTNTTNDYTGNTSATNSALVFGTGAVPLLAANGSFTLGAGGYIGNQDLSLVPSLWIGKFSPSIITGVIGFDTSDNATPNVVGGVLTPISLSQFTGNGTSIALGTTSTATLAGTITLPTGQSDYYFTGYKGGWLTVSSALSGAHGVRIGDANGYYPEFDPADSTRISTVFLNSSNTHTGGTTLYSGRLVLGDAGALGSGALTIAGSTTGILPRLETSLTSNPTFSNAMIVKDDFQISGLQPFTWSGNIADGTSTGAIFKYGSYNLTISGNNAGFSGGFNLEEGTLTFASNTAAGTGALNIGYPGGTAAFTSSAPTLNGLASDTTSAQVQLGSGTTLTINQTSSSTFRGVISGPGALVKSGTGTLRLESASTYTGGTTISAGTLNAGATGALGNNTVTLNGTSSKLLLDSGVTIANPIVFGANGGLLAGQGTLSSAVALGANSGIAPGSSIGLLSFSNGLTWGSGGFYQLQVQDAGGIAGTGWDSVQVTGTLAFTATLGSPFTIYLSSLNGGGANGNPANFSGSSAYSWMIASATTFSGFNASAITINTSGFTAGLNGGAFSLSTSGNALLLNFTPAAIPEPSTWALLVTGAGVFALTRLRRRR